MKFTSSCKRALAWINDREGHGVIDRYGKLMAKGEAAHFAPATWLRLVILGYLASNSMGGLGVTQIGREALNGRS